MQGHSVGATSTIHLPVEAKDVALELKGISVGYYKWMSIVQMDIK